jgi:hypothetical protein
MAICLSGGLTYFFGDLLTNKTDVLGIVATIFSILAGVLMAVISILGDPSMLLDQSWRHSYFSATETQRQLHRQTDIFVIYVVLLIGLFVFMLCDVLSPWFWYVQRGVFFLTSLAFIASLSLPYTLKTIQRRRLQRIIDGMKTASKA